MFVCSGLETFWQSAFCWFFRPFLTGHGHLWTLEPTQLPPLSVEWPWHSISYLAKVRFQCKVNWIEFPTCCDCDWLKCCFVVSVQASMDIDEGSSGLLVPHPTTRRRDLLWSFVQIVWTEMQFLQPFSLSRWGNFAFLLFQWKSFANSCQMFLVWISASTVVSRWNRKCCQIPFRPSHRCVLRRKEDEWSAPECSFPEQQAH